MLIGTPEGSPMSGTLLRALMATVMAALLRRWGTAGALLVLPHGEDGVGVATPVGPFVWVVDVYFFANSKESLRIMLCG